MLVKKIVEKFDVNGEFIAYNPYGEGHINDTFALTFNENGKMKRYILQKMNENVFPNIQNLMENIFSVTDFLRRKMERAGKDVEKSCLTFIKTLDDKFFCVDENNNKWRLMLMIENTEAYQIAVSKEIFRKTGLAFGEFIRMLEDFPVCQLNEIIPNFHNTAVRLQAFKKALKNNDAKRRRYCRDDVKFVLNNEDLCYKVVNLLASGQIPVRVTHNDTKINNILMDSTTGEAVCVIDLDTIMPGSLIYDFGDAIRSGCNTAFEDEKDLSKVDFDIEMFQNFAKGFIAGVGNSLTTKEKENLAIGAILITFECGIRFLTDYLNGDKYFKVQYSNHNLVRARTQFKLVEIMQSRLNEMEEIINNIN